MNKNSRTNNSRSNNSSKKSKKNVKFIKNNKINKLRGAAKNDIEEILNIIASRSPIELLIAYNYMIAFKYGTDKEKHFYEINKDDDYNINIILKALQYNKTIVNFIIRSTILSSENIVALARTLKNNNTITKLNINYSDIDTQVLKELQGNTRLTELNISFNKLGDIGVQALSTALTSMTALKELDISNNEIGHIGAQALSTALKGNTILTTLNISNNIIDLKGIESLSTALKGNTILTTLNISNNIIDLKGIESLSKMLNSMTALKELDISNNIDLYRDDRFQFPLHEPLTAFTALAEALKENKTLININVMLDGISFDRYKPIELIIIEVLKVNETIKIFIFSPYQKLFNPILNLQTFTEEENKEIDENIDFIKNKLKYKNLENYDNKIKEQEFNRLVSELCLIDRYFKILTHNNYNKGKKSMQTLANNETYILDLHGEIYIPYVTNTLFLLPDNINVIFLDSALYKTFVYCSFHGQFKTEINKNLNGYLNNPYCFDNPDISNIFKEAIIYYGGQYCIELQLSRGYIPNDFVTGLSHMVYNENTKIYDTKTTGLPREHKLQETLSSFLQRTIFSKDKKYTILLTSCRETTDSTRGNTDISNLLVFYEQQLKLLNFKIYYDINTKEHNKTLNNRYSKCRSNIIHILGSVNQVQEGRPEKGTVKSRQDYVINNNTEIISNSVRIYLKDIKILIENIKDEHDETIVFDKLCQILKINKIKTLTNKSYYTTIRQNLQKHKNRSTRYKNNTINNLSNEVKAGAASIFISSKHNNQIMDFIFKDKPELRAKFLAHCDKTYKMLIPFNRLKIKDMIKIKETLNNFNQPEFTEDINKFIENPLKQDRRKLWHTLSLKYHPDTNRINNPETATSKMQFINFLAVIYGINEREAIYSNPDSNKNNGPLSSNA